MKIIKELIPYLIIIIVVILIRTFLITPVRVSGSSMDDTLSNGDILLLKKYDKSFNRYDIVVFDKGSERLIKRIIGMPGEYIECINGEIYINDNKIKDIDTNLITNDFPKTYIKTDEYFVMGDNRVVSNDSRYFGPVKKSKLQGKVSFVIFPFSHFGKIKEKIHLD